MKITNSWKLTRYEKRKPKLKNPILIEGLPGIGNVGKIAVDFLIDELNAKKLYSFFSYTFPHSVFINEQNLVDLPSISLYYVKQKERDILFLAGDIQPTEETSCYEFSELVLDVLSEFGGKEIVTLGGIGLAEIPEIPKVYCTANNSKIIKSYKKFGKLNNKIYGVVGPIIGVTGILLGLAKERDIDAISLLVETFGHPMYLGVKGSSELLKILKKRLKIKVDLKALDKEIAKIEKEMVQRKEDLMNISKQTKLGKINPKLGDESTSYIG